MGDVLGAVQGLWTLKGYLKATQKGDKDHSCIALTAARLFHRHYVNSRLSPHCTQSALSA